MLKYLFIGIYLHGFEYNKVVSYCLASFLLVCFFFCFIVPTNRNLKNLPCVVLRTGAEGVCMFAIHCLKANGTHLGTCRDGYYFKSCCHINVNSERFQYCFICINIV